MDLQILNLDPNLFSFFFFFFLGLIKKFLSKRVPFSSGSSREANGDYLEFCGRFFTIRAKKQMRMLKRKSRKMRHRSKWGRRQICWIFFFFFFQLSDMGITDFTCPWIHTYLKCPNQKITSNRELPKNFEFVL